MLGNCERMVLISSASNEWPQPQNNQIDDQKGGFNMMGSSIATGVGVRVMDHQKVSSTITTQDHHNHNQQSQQQQQKPQNQEPLRCPRCDSNNTKFCYYNNYSLSQPRYFCKACKRYWTSGGTLRNVPVGGGCRRNKRVKRPSSTHSCSSSSSLTNSSLDQANSTSSNGGGGGCISSLPTNCGGNFHDLISSASNHVNPLFYGIPTNQNHSSEINFPFSRYDLQNPPQINGLGLGFSSSSCGLLHNMNGDDNGEYRNGLNLNIHNHPAASRQIFQDLISSNPLLSNYTNTTTTTTSPTISSLFSSLQMKGSNNFQTLLPSYHEDDIHNMKGSGMFNKGVKMELEGQNRSIIDHHHHRSAPSQNQMDQTMGSSSSDASIIWGTGSNLGAWLDPSNNIGSSVPSLI